MTSPTMDAHRQPADPKDSQNFELGVRQMHDARRQHTPIGGAPGAGSTVAEEKFPAL